MTYKSRTFGYMNAIKQNPELIRDKIVLDIGCGTGVLSIFAAQAGAKHVYAIECAGIANHVIYIFYEKFNNNYCFHYYMTYLI